MILLACNQLKKSLPGIIEKFHSFQPEVPIISIIDKDSPVERERLLRAKATDYISLSNFSEDTLNRSIRYALQNAEQRKLIQELRDTDSLTGLGNRQFFYRELETKLEQNKKMGTKLAVISMDINNFRAMNSRYGQHHGDIVVEELARRLSLIESEKTSTARLGNDEFSIIVDISAYEDTGVVTKEIIQKIMNSIMQPVVYGRSEVQIKCSIGASFYPEHGDDAEQLVHRAVVARQESKKAFETRYTFFSNELESRDNLYSELAPQIAFALRSNQFVLHYQPQINLRNGQIEGAEALIRWQHPEKGLLYPDSFIPICEQMGLIVPIGYWIIHQACMDINRLKSSGIDLKHIGVNLSFRQFGDDNLVPTIKRILEKTKADTSVLELELTESALHDDQNHVISCLQSLSETGLSFSLDDFGTGYSSFSLLQKLPIDTIKIDRSFITNVTTCADDAEIVRAIINLAHNMGKSVIAEGVEEQHQLDFLVEQECDFVQGYFFSKPVSFDLFQHTLLKCAAAV
ncbi:putative bifunctional diguanylate cyclase/phosphodiesterase [Neptuniibacter halophilus]|uniref:putative bifunctional diguanylate cyclase/phosphodiesterase n=1 Tax=Neptuniibacter halophilus TaxID=651666 RepID=UPI002572C5D4|nr:GGDEF domain-containing response regulator [Neptuniibacter halophilus]